MSTPQYGSPPGAQPQPFMTPTPAPKKKRGRWILPLLIGLAVGGIVGSAGNQGTADPIAPGPVRTVTAPARTVTAPAEAPTSDQPGGSQDDAIGDGSYLVGKDIETGQYKATGDPDAMLCYADTQDKDGKILEQETADAGDTVIIRIKKSAYSFKSQGCGTWTQV